jgi:sugar phosphate isomerase/epimerase
MRRIGFRTGGFAAWDTERVVRGLAEIGYGCIELCLEHPDTQPAAMTPARCREVAALLGDLNLTLSSISYHGDGRSAEERAQSSILAVEIAEQMGCPILVVNTMRAEAGREEEQTCAALDLTRRLLDHGTRSVLLAFEPEPGLVIGTVADMTAFMARAGSDRVRVNLDIGHAAITEPKLPAAIMRLGAAIVHTHIEDIAGRVHKHLVLGEGEIDFAEARAALDGVGYRGDYTVDMFPLGDDPLDTARRCFEGMQRWFGPIR